MQFSLCIKTRSVFIMEESERHKQLRRISIFKYTVDLIYTTTLIVISVSNWLVAADIERHLTAYFNNILVVGIAMVVLALIGFYTMHSTRKLVK